MVIVYYLIWQVLMINIELVDVMLNETYTIQDNKTIFTNAQEAYLSLSEGAIISIPDINRVYEYISKVITNNKNNTIVKIYVKNRKVE